MKYKLINGWTKNKMKEYIVKYNKNTPAVDNQTCVYETEDGNRCAIGIFIPDSFKIALKFDSGVKKLLDKYPELNDYMPLEIEGLKRMQDIHDNPFNSNTHAVLLGFVNNEVTE
jgi:hypothetical protein